jgi:hypothetical protein
MAAKEDPNRLGHHSKLRASMSRMIIFISTCRMGQYLPFGVLARRRTAGSRWSAILLFAAFGFPTLQYAFGVLREVWDRMRAQARFVMLSGRPPPRHPERIPGPFDSSNAGSPFPSKPSSFADGKILRGGAPGGGAEIPGGLELRHGGAPEETRLEPPDGRPGLERKTRSTRSGEAPKRRSTGGNICDG